MSCTFSVAARSDHGAGASLLDLTVATYLAWIFPTTIPSFRICQKGLAASGTRLFNLGTSGFLEVQVARATTASDAISSSNALTVNNWWFAGGQHDTGGADSAQKLFVGSPTAAAVEVSTYSAQTAGSGAVGSNATKNLYIGNNANFDVGFLGSIFWVGIYNRLLSLGEIQEQQLITSQRIVEVISGCQLFTYFSPQGLLGVQTDYSTNGNNGTLTGATYGVDEPRARLPYSSLLRPRIFAPGLAR